MIDWWTIDGKKWGLPYDFHVRLTPCGSGAPDSRYDCYDEKDLAAWERGDWCFVTAEVVPRDEFGTVYEGARQFLGEIEWGEMPSVSIDRERLEETHLKDMAMEAREEADQIRRRIAESIQADA